MSDDYTPTTEQVRDGYRYDPNDDYYNPLQAGANAEYNGRAFDRWLYQTLREAKAEAWDECCYETMGQGTAQIPDNPYRKETQA